MIQGALALTMPTAGSRIQPLEQVVASNRPSGVIADETAADAAAIAAGRALDLSRSCRPIDFIPVDDINKVSSLKTIKATKAAIESKHLPDELQVRTFKLGGAGGPSLQIAENFGATPVQITVNGKDLLCTNAVEDKYTKTLNGAGSIGGIPIVAPAGRTLSDDGQAVMKGADGTRLASFDTELIGKEGRIPADPNGVMCHGGIFTSQNWKCSGVKRSGEPNNLQAIELTYTLDFEQDPALRAMGKGQIEAVYSFALGEGGKAIFDSRLKVISKEGPVYLGALAQHSFFQTHENDTLETPATEELKTHDQRPELPTGEVVSIKAKGDNDFSSAKRIHDVKAREVVLRGYADVPKAILRRPSEGLVITTLANGCADDVPGYDGYLVCHKEAGKLMLEPIARYPNIMNVYKNSNRPEIKPVIVTPDQAFRTHYRITAEASK